MGPLAPYRWAAAATGADGLSPSAQAVLSVLALALGAAAFLAVLRHARSGRFTVRMLLSLAIGLQGLVVTLPLLASNDVISYATYGRIAGVHGANPYVETPADFPDDPLARLAYSEWSDEPAHYGPAFVRLSALLASVFPNPATLILAFKVLAGAAGAALLLLTLRLARRLAPERSAFVVALVGLNPLLLFVVIGGAHNDLLVALPIVGALLLLTPPPDASRPWTARELLATVLLTLATAVKMVGVVPLLLHIAVAVGRRSGRLRVSAAATHMILTMGLFLALAAPFLQDENRTLGLVGVLSYGTVLAPALFLGEAVASVGRVVGVAVSAGPVSQLSSIAFLGWCAWTFGRLMLRSVLRLPGGVPAEVQGQWWGGALFLLALGTTLVWPWYLAWAIPLAWLLPRRPRVAVVTASVVAPLAVAVIIQPSFATAEGLRVGLPLWLVAPVLLVTVVSVARYLSGSLREPDRGLQPQPAASSAPARG
jgi:alpha-1,6-mannosyltransferase